MLKIREKFNKVPPLFKYLYYSALVTVLDVVIVWILYRPLKINLVIANTTGVVAGFLVHYLLASKSVFESEYGVKGFIIYLATFLFGLVLANGLIYACEYYIFISMHRDISFLLSKGVSVVVPFFALYYLRKFLFGILRKNNEGMGYGQHQKV